MVEEGKYKELTGKIIGCCMEVHTALGCGFQEVIYQRALEVEFRRQQIEAVREFEMPIYYRQVHIGTGAYMGRSVPGRRRCGEEVFAVCGDTNRGWTISGTAISCSI